MLNPGSYTRKMACFPGPKTLPRNNSLKNHQDSQYPCSPLRRNPAHPRSPIGATHGSCLSWNKSSSIAGLRLQELLSSLSHGGDGWSCGQAGAGGWTAPAAAGSPHRAAREWLGTARLGTARLGRARLGTVGREEAAGRPRPGGQRLPPLPVPAPGVLPLPSRAGPGLGSRVTGGPRPRGDRGLMTGLSAGCSLGEYHRLGENEAERMETSTREAKSSWLRCLCARRRAKGPPGNTTPARRAAEPLNFGQGLRRKLHYCSERFRHPRTVPVCDLL